MRHSLVFAAAALCAVVSTASAQQAAPAPAPVPQQASTAGAQANPPAAQPPLPNRLNSVLPAWFRARGEFRQRLEGFDGLGFNAASDDHYYLSRVRLNATVVTSRRLSFQLQVQDARVAQKTVPPTGAPFKAAFDVRQGFADIGSAESRVALRVGRQELAYGDQRLVGHLGWSNAARSFDAAKLSVRGSRLQLDVFAASVVRILDGELDKSGNGNRFAGAYAVAPSLVPNGSLEPYLFWRHDQNIRSEAGTPGTLDVATIGLRWVGRLPGNVEYNTDTALQTGSVAADDISAWAGHYQLRSPAAGRAAFRVSSEFNYASGDANPSDGTRGTFDQLYPTGHDKYGLADQVGWRNIRHARAGIELTPFRGLPVIASYHSWWVNEKRDGLYNSGGALLARVAAGAASSHVGQEIDVQVTKAIAPQLQVAAGYAHIFTGRFLQEATPGASYSHPYVMATYVFLAER